MKKETIGIALTILTVAMSGCGRKEAGEIPSSAGGGELFYRPEAKSSQTSRDLMERQRSDIPGVFSEIEALTDTGRVRLTVMPPMPGGMLTEEMSRAIAMKMLGIMASEGLGGLNNSPDFAFTATMTEGDVRSTGTAPQRTIGQYTINFSVINTRSGDVYGSTSRSLSGVGASKEEALLNAIGSIGDDREMEKMLALASDRIVSWYETNLEGLKNEVEVACAKGDYALALALLGAVPSEATATYAYAMEQIPGVAGKFRNRIAAEELAHLREAIQMAGDSPSAAVYAHLAMIPVESQEYKTASELVSRYEQRVENAASRDREDAVSHRALQEERAYQLKLAEIEQQKLMARYQADATAQALRVSLYDRNQRNKGFWSSLGSRIIDGLDNITGHGDTAGEIINSNLTPLLNK